MTVNNLPLLFTLFWHQSVVVDCLSSFLPEQTWGLKSYFFLHALESALGNEVTERSYQQSLSSADGSVIVSLFCDWVYCPTVVLVSVAGWWISTDILLQYLCNVNESEMPAAVLASISCILIPIHIVIQQNAQKVTPCSLLNQQYCPSLHDSEHFIGSVTFPDNSRNLTWHSKNTPCCVCFLLNINILSELCRLRGICQSY